ncbi:hypothetical protein Tco_0602761, partial [Tanacetum coccineum]
MLTTLTMLILLVQLLMLLAQMKLMLLVEKINIELPFYPYMHALEDDSIFDFSRDDEDDGIVADMNDLDT